MSTRLCDHKHPSCLDINKPANSPPQYVIEKPMICCLLRVDMIIPPGIASLCHYESKSLCFNPEVMSNYVHVNILHFHIEHGIYHFSCGDPRRPQQEEAILLFQACETTMNKTSLECVCVSVCVCVCYVFRYLAGLQTSNNNRGYLSRGTIRHASSIVVRSVRVGRESARNNWLTSRCLEPGGRGERFNATDGQMSLNSSLNTNPVFQLFLYANSKVKKWSSVYVQGQYVMFAKGGADVSFKKKKCNCL